MFGHKAEAEAVVIVREMLHESSVEHGSNYHPWHYEKWRFVVEVRPEAALAYRAGIEQKIRIPDFIVPAVGSKVRVAYEKHPDQAELVHDGDGRYDIALSNREERDREKAGKAGRDAAFQAALDAPAGIPPAGGPPGGGPEAAQGF